MLLPYYEVYIKNKTSWFLNIFFTRLFICSTYYKPLTLNLKLILENSTFSKITLPSSHGNRRTYNIPWLYSFHFFEGKFIRFIKKYFHLNLLVLNKLFKLQIGIGVGESDLRLIGRMSHSCNTSLIIRLFISQHFPLFSLKSFSPKVKETFPYNLATSKNNNENN